MKYWIAIGVLTFSAFLAQAEEIYYTGFETTEGWATGALSDDPEQQPAGGAWTDAGVGQVQNYNPHTGDYSLYLNSVAGGNNRGVFVPDAPYAGYSTLTLSFAVYFPEYQLYADDGVTRITQDNNFRLELVTDTTTLRLQFDNFDTVGNPGRQRAYISDGLGEEGESGLINQVWEPYEWMYVSFTLDFENNTYSWRVDSPTQGENSVSDRAIGHDIAQLEQIVLWHRDVTHGPHDQDAYVDDFTIVGEELIITHTEFLGGDILDDASWTAGQPGGGMDGLIQFGGTISTPTALTWYGDAAVTIDGGYVTREDGNVTTRIGPNAFLQIVSGDFATEGGLEFNRSGFEIIEGEISANFINFYGSGEGLEIGGGTISGGTVTVDEMRLYNNQDAQKTLHIAGGAMTVNGQLRLGGGTGPDGYVTVSGGHISIQGSEPIDWGAGYLDFLHAAVGQASLTVNGFAQSDYETLFVENRIRFNGGNVGDFSDHFTVVGNTLYVMSEGEGVTKAAVYYTGFELTEGWAVGPLGDFAELQPGGGAWNHSRDAQVQDTNPYLGGYSLHFNSGSSGNHTASFVPDLPYSIYSALTVTFYAYLPAYEAWSEDGQTGISSVNNFRMELVTDTTVLRMQFDNFDTAGNPGRQRSYVSSGLGPEGEGGLVNQSWEPGEWTRISFTLNFFENTYSFEIDSPTKGVSTVSGRAVGFDIAQLEEIVLWHRDVTHGPHDQDLYIDEFLVAYEPSEFLGGDVMDEADWTNGRPGDGVDGLIEEDGVFNAPGQHILWYQDAFVAIDGGHLSRTDGTTDLTISTNGYLRINGGGLSTGGGLIFDHAGFEINDGYLTASYIALTGAGEGAYIGRGQISGGTVMVDDLRLFNDQGTVKELIIRDGTVLVSGQLQLSNGAGSDGVVTFAGPGQIILSGDDPFAWGDGYINFLSTLAGGAKLTVSGFTASDYEALFTQNRLRIDGGTEGEFADWFEVDGDTLTVYQRPTDWARIYLPFEGIAEARVSSAWVNRGITGFEEKASRLGAGWSPLVTPYDHGVKGQAYDASGDVAATLMWGEFGDNSPTPLEGATDEITSFTLTAWIRSDAGESLNNQRIVTTPNFEVNYLAASEGEDGQLSVRMGHDGNWYSSSVTPGFGIRGRWTFVAIVWDGTKESDQLRFYHGGTNAVVELDTALTTDVTGMLSNDSHGGNLWLGNTASTTAGDQTFRGYIDEFRIFSSDDGADGALTAEILEQVRLIDLDPLESGPPRSVTIENPYAGIDWATVGQHTANLHTHTRFSDGYFDPHHVIDLYHAAGYTILALTDHDAHPYAVRPETLYPWTALSNIYEEIKDEYSSRWSMTWEQASDEPWQDRDPEALGMVSIEGVEVSLRHHIGSYFNNYADRLSAEEDSLQEIQDRGGLAVFFHPLWASGPTHHQKPYDWYVDYFQQFDALVGIEIVSGSDGAWSPPQRELWDEILNELMPERPVWGFASDDMHTMDHFGRQRTVFLVDELTPEHVRAAMENGQTYLYHHAGAGRFSTNLLLLQAVEVNAEHIALTVPEYDLIYWSTFNPYTGLGEVIHRGPVLPLDRIPGHAAFVRAYISGNDARIWTQPFGVLEAADGLQSYAEWLLEQNIPEGAQGYGDDPYDVGMPNLIAYATGLAPDVAGQQPLSIRLEEGDPEIALPWRTDISPDAYFEVESSTNLVEWILETNLIWRTIPLGDTRDEYRGLVPESYVDRVLYLRVLFSLSE